MTSTITSRADVRTDSPARYAKQLIAHLGRKTDFLVEGDTFTATIGGAVAQVVIGDGVLTLLARGNDVDAIGTVEDVLGSHLALRLSQPARHRVDTLAVRR